MLYVERVAAETAIFGAVYETMVAESFCATHATKARRWWWNADLALGYALPVVL